ncbi:hypothetical protein H634G_04350 [Metarhizium anisopliae BRIP 53293]|uniref:Uncharacterized protein n=1 Tax=Metarhizium anisopliae BRIP 53293 TaxID=1291518 RepID=A0A0D9P1Z9_METAN|nr:hypothetical protein H634G_04350 [Metarhizium anisopliae BRIP 53293]KJK92861.1 hypothetical protein H633G_03237 [Metarhizium anisopliae BRIP 53284]
MSQRRVNRTATVQWREFQREESLPIQRSFVQFQPRRISSNLELPETLAGISIRVPCDQNFKNTEIEDPVFEAVAATAQLGIDILHSSTGFSGLMDTGKQIIEETLRNNPNQRCRDAKGIENHTKDYLKRITENFPVLLVHDMRAATNGRTTKGTWEVPQDRLFPPHHAGAIEINRMLVDRLIDARQAALLYSNDQNARDRFYTLSFRIGATIAHELCHVFTTFLLYDPNANTPPAVSYAGWGNTMVGESGRRWESLTFGGVVDMRQGSWMERVGLKLSGGRRTFVVNPPSFKAIARRDLSVFPLVDEDCSKRGGKPHIIDTGSWLAKYGNIYEAYSENDNHQPERLPKHVLDHAMSGADNYTRLSADKLRDWTLVVDEGVGGKTNFSCTIKMSA